MSAGSALPNPLDDGWVLDESPAPVLTSVAETADRADSVDDGWALEGEDEPMQRPQTVEHVLTIVADAADEYPDDDTDAADGWGLAYSDDEAAFFAAGDAMAATPAPPVESFDDLAVGAPKSFWQRLIRRAP